jgi:cytochrome c
LLLFLAIITVATTQSNYMGLRRNSDEPLPTLGLITGSSEQVLRGAELYDWHCAVCHGPTALGFEEAKLAFPESHRKCESCHRPNNPGSRGGFMGDGEREVFSVGIAPDLRSEGALETFPTALVLNAYIQSAMPRYEPGRLTVQESLDITAFLLALHEVRLEEDLSEANAAQISVSP